MAKRPLLIFPFNADAQRTDRQRLNIQPPFLPSIPSQMRRLNQRISQLDVTLRNKTAYLANSPGNFVAEMILVFEIAGTIDDFFKAVELTPGLDFLMEYKSDFLADEYFALRDKYGQRTNANLDSRLFFTMTNQQAIRELLRHWDSYTKKRQFVHGSSRFRKLFEQLKDLRPYGVQDRVIDTGILEDIEDLKSNGVQEVYFEIELAYREDPRENLRAFREVEILLNQHNGRAIHESRTLISEIRYHAFVALAPINSFDDITENTHITFLQSQQILFFRPVGQAISFPIEEDEDDFPRFENAVVLDRLIDEPLVAIFDGYPLSNHVLLRDRLIIDDPDEFGNNYLARDRRHGTAMASLILHGDLSDLEQVTYGRKVYLRPIMVPTVSGQECLPFDRLPIDLIHRAVKRMFDGEDGEPGMAPNVKIINFSIGDIFRPFNLNISTWAKLIDWLSYKYNVLFVISAGNITSDFDIEIPNREFNDSTPAQKEQALYKIIVSENYHRKITSPAEAINALTVGATHSDAFEMLDLPERLNLINTPNNVSPISRIGFGFNLSVKPEILMPGGRKLFRKKPVQDQQTLTKLRMEPPFENQGPGNQLAMPGVGAETDRVGFSCGTSNSTALTTRLGAKLLEILIKLNEEADADNQIPSDYFALLIKALLIHGANLGAAKDIFTSILNGNNGISAGQIKKHISPYLGFGAINSERILYCTDKRVTLLGFGKLKSGNAHIYSFPLPPSIGQKIIDKKLTITLTWFSPLNFQSSKYRQIHMYFDNLAGNGLLTLDRQDYDFRATQKGTSQHDVLTGNYADAFIDGAELRIKVNCRNDASGAGNQTEIRYALCVTLELNENQPIEIYKEIKDRIRPRVQQRA